MSGEICICRKCNSGVEIRPGEDHTGFCDGCAQEMIQTLVTVLEEIRDHPGEDENGCAMKSYQWREHLQELAFIALDQFGLTERDVEGDEE